MSNQEFVNRQFEEFQNLWELTNKKPLVHEVKDTLSLWSIRIVLLGAMGLSGTRTGSMIAETEQLSRFMGLLGVSPTHSWLFTGLEAILGFTTVEATLFASGYLLGDSLPIVGKKGTTKQWFLAFMFAGILPALVSNLGPAAYLIGVEFYDFWLVVVNVIVGLSTFTLALIGGRILSMIETEFKNTYATKLQDWEDRRQAAWFRSAQYKLIRSKQKPSLIGSTNFEEDIYKKINGQTTIDTLRQDLNLSEKDIMKHLATLQQQGRIKVNGVSVRTVS